MKEMINPEWTQGFTRGGTVALESILSAYQGRLAAEPNGTISFADLVEELKVTIPMVTAAVALSERAIRAGVRPTQASRALLEDAHDTGIAALDEFMDEIRKIEASHEKPA